MNNARYDSMIENGMVLGVAPFTALERGPRLEDDDVFFLDDCREYWAGFPWEEDSNA